MRRESITVAKEEYTDPRHCHRRADQLDMVGKECHRGCCVILIEEMAVIHAEVVIVPMSFHGPLVWSSHNGLA